MEGLHSIVKRWLTTSTNDLLGVVNMLKLMLKQQHARIRDGLAAAQARPPFRVQPKFLPILPAKINECITPYALAKVREQYELAKDPAFAERRLLRPCTKSFNKIYGLPCCHQIADALHTCSNWTINRHDIDAHWYFERPQHLGPQPAIRLPSPPAIREPFIREPLVVRSSGRPRADDRDRTTRRNPSHWEQPVNPTPPSQLQQPPSQNAPINTPVAPIATRGQRGQRRGSHRGRATRGRGGGRGVSTAADNDISQTGGLANRARGVRRRGRPSLAVCSTV
jgi:hypothetical protein